MRAFQQAQQSVGRQARGAWGDTAHLLSVSSLSASNSSDISSVLSSCYTQATRNCFHEGANLSMKMSWIYVMKTKILSPTEDFLFRKVIFLNMKSFFVSLPMSRLYWVFIYLYIYHKLFYWCGQHSNFHERDEYSWRRSLDFFVLHWAEIVSSLLSHRVSVFIFYVAQNLERIYFQWNILSCSLWKPFKTCFVKKKIYQ